jgi:ABC-type antimicrobial peptide transport system permease subunit
VLERTREFGVMQAIGTRHGGIIAVVLAESFWIATVSVVFGLALGLGVNWYGSHNALLDMTRSVGESISLGGVVMGSTFKTRLSIPEGLAAARYVYVMALLVGLYPAWRVSRMRPVEALHAK